MIVFLCVFVGIGYVDRIHVDKPVAITDQPDPEQRTLWYSALCNNLTLESEVMAFVTYPTKPSKYNDVAGEVVYKDFNDGCNGNVAYANGPTNVLLWTCGLFGLLVSLCIVWLLVRLGFGKNNNNNNNRTTVAIAFGLKLVLLSFSLILYLTFSRMEPIEQCNPLPVDLYGNKLSVDWAPKFTFFSNGAFWNIPTWIKVLWVKNVVVPNCPGVQLDLSNKYQPRMWVKAEASVLVKETIASTIQSLYILMWIATACTSIDWLIFVIIVGMIYRRSNTTKTVVITYPVSQINITVSMQYS